MLGDAPMSQRDHYDVLGVTRNSTPEEVKAAFRKLAAQHHPDKNPDDPHASIRFKEINAAYQVLSDSQRRAMYDRFGHRAEESGSPFASGGPFAGGVVDFSDIAVDGILGDLLGVFGVGRGDKGDIKRELTITFEESASGCTKEISYDRIVPCGDCSGSGSAPGSRPDTCSACNGRGRVRFQQGLLPIAVERVCQRCRGKGTVVTTPCQGCKGSGLITSPNTIEVTIPPGVEHGAARVVTGAGNRPRADRAAGDLELSIFVAPHPFYRRAGDDVVCTVPITVTQAALGAEVDVPTLAVAASLVSSTCPPSTERAACACPLGRSRVTCCASRAKVCPSAPASAAAISAWRSPSRSPRSSRRVSASCSRSWPARRARRCSRSSAPSWRSSRISSAERGAPLARPVGRPT